MFIRESPSGAFLEGNNVGDILRWDGQEWQAVSTPGGLLPAGVLAGDLLIWNGAAWVPVSNPGGLLPVGTEIGQQPTWNGSAYVAGAGDRTDGIGDLAGAPPTVYYHARYAADLVVAAGHLGSWAPHAWDGKQLNKTGGTMAQAVALNRPVDAAAGWVGNRRAIQGIAANSQNMTSTDLGLLLTAAQPFWLVMAIQVPAGPGLQVPLAFDDPGAGGPSLRIATHFNPAANMSVITQTTLPTAPYVYDVPAILGITATATAVTVLQLTQGGGTQVIINNQPHAVTSTTPGMAALFSSLVGGVPGSFADATVRAWAMKIGQSLPPSSLADLMAHFVTGLDCPLA